MKTVHKDKTFFEHTYGNGNRVEVTDSGVVIWDNNCGRWVMDASTLEADSTFSVANIKDETHKHYESLYVEPIKPKKSRRKK